MKRRDFLNFVLMVCLSSNFLGQSLVEGNLAFADSGAPAWESLSNLEKEKFKKMWEWFKSQTVERQGVLQRAYERFQSFPLEMQQRILANYERWKKMSDQERASLRGRMAQFRSMPKAQQDEMRERARTWQGLSEEQRARIRSEIGTTGNAVKSAE